MHNKYNQNGSSKKRKILTSPQWSTEQEGSFYHEVHLALVVHKIFISRLSAQDTSMNWSQVPRTVSKEAAC